MKKEVIFSASMICGNPLSLLGDLSKICHPTNSSIGALHIDFMDGVFVPRFGMYTEQLYEIRKMTKKHIECHLMVKDPNSYIQELINAGADEISFHYEGNNSIMRTYDLIKKYDKKACLVLNLQTSINQLNPILHYFDSIMLMSINPGIVDSNMYLQTVENKIKQLRYCEYEGNIAIDGGVRWQTLDNLIKKGANYFVCGTGVLFNKDGIENNMKKLKEYL